MAFAFSSAPAASPTSGSKYLEPGINTDVHILDITSSATAAGKEYIGVLVSKTDNPAEGRELKVWMSTEKAQEMGVTKLKHLLLAVATEEQVNQAGDSATDVPSLAKNLRAIGAGKVIHELKLIGREYEKDGKIRVGTELGLPNFARRADSPFQLKYDENNRYDFERLTLGNASQNSGSAINGLPGSGAGAPPAPSPGDELPF